MTTETELTPNQQRASYAAEALKSSEHYATGDQIGARDLLSDLMHLCSGKGYDFADLLRMATDNFNSEVMDGELERGKSTTGEAA